MEKAGRTQSFHLAAFPAVDLEAVKIPGDICSWKNGLCFLDGATE